MGNPPVHRARKRFGQNFLHDQTVIQRIIHAINPKPNEHIVEIGPGKGALTKELLPLVGQMDAVELDRDLLEPLQETCQSLGQLTIHAADALKFDFCSLADNGKQKLRIVGNLPYNISTPLLFHLMEQRHCIADMHFMLQKEVVERITARPGNRQYGRLSIMLQYYCHAEHLFNVSPGAFYPPPKVDSAVFRLTPITTPSLTVVDEALLSRVVSLSFSQRRKTIRNNLKGTIDEVVLTELGIDPGLRPEKLELEQFVSLANWLSAHQKT